MVSYTLTNHHWCLRLLSITESFGFMLETISRAVTLFGHIGVHVILVCEHKRLPVNGIGLQHIFGCCRRAYLVESFRSQFVVVIDLREPLTWKYLQNNLTSNVKLRRKFNLIHIYSVRIAVSVICQTFWSDDISVLNFFEVTWAENGCFKKRPAVAGCSLINSAMPTLGVPCSWRGRIMGKYLVHGFTEL